MGGVLDCAPLCNTSIETLTRPFSVAHAQSHHYSIESPFFSRLRDKRIMLSSPPQQSAHQLTLHHSSASHGSRQPYGNEHRRNSLGRDHWKDHICTRLDPTIFLQ